MQRSGFVARKCSKCGGNVYLDRDQFGWYEQCLQCGLVSDLKNIVEVKKSTVKEPVRTR
ncbi:MAG: hypothetical protein JXA46_05130 [Dehalococcoidales bacterium]|nr:hypothetical protein [Dehalococcoidales bacterium]